MLEANPQLTPAQIRDILQRTATPLPPYYAHEVGAGMLNAQAAVLESAFPQRHFGAWRGTAYQNQVQFISSAPQVFSGIATPGASSSSETGLAMPADALLASVQIAWGGSQETNNLTLTMLDPEGASQLPASANNQPGLTGRRQRVVLSNPAAGTWKARVTATPGSARATSQTFTGVLLSDEPAVRDVDGYRLARQQFCCRDLSELPQPGDVADRTAVSSQLLA